VGEWWVRIKADCALSTTSDWKLVERRHREDAAAELLEVIRSFPTPVKLVVEMRASGLGWGAIGKELPGRAYFSILEDWRWALRRISQRHDDLVRRLN